MIIRDGDKWSLRETIVLTEMEGDGGDPFQIYNHCKAEAINIVWGQYQPLNIQRSQAQLSSVLLFLQQITSAN